MLNYLKSYLELFKLKIGFMELVATLIGYLLGSQGRIDFWPLSATLVGTLLSCCGAATLNCYIERDIDPLMQRTCMRPIARGIISPASALGVGVTLVLGSVTFLALTVNLLTAFLALLTCFLYVLVYTPLKRLTWLNTLVGAIPGAIPPLGGWAAATGQLSLGAWVLFVILFIWQHPHFYAIAWIYRKDYESAGLKMLPVVDPSGESTFRQILIYSLILVPVSILPAMSGILGPIYLIGATFVSSAMLYVGFIVSDTRTEADARKLLKTSLFFLPGLLISIVLDSHL